MFVSIATFVLGNVKIFENKNLWASLSVMFGFAASLLLFNAFFKWIIAENILINKSTTDIRKVSISFSDTVMYSSIVVMVLLSISLASYSYNLENTNQAEIIKRWIEIDKKKEGAIKAIKLKLDSLITMNKIKKSRLTTSNIQNSPMKN